MTTAIGKDRLLGGPTVIPVADDPFVDEISVGESFLAQRSLQNHMVPVSAHQIPHQARMWYKDGKKRGMRAHALTTYTQLVNQALRGNQPHQVFYAPQSQAFNKSANHRFRRH